MRKAISLDPRGMIQISCGKGCPLDNDLVMYALTHLDRYVIESGVFIAILTTLKKNKKVDPAIRDHVIRLSDDLMMNDEEIYIHKHIARTELCPNNNNKRKHDSLSE